MPTYAKVRYEEIYPGVDLVFYGTQKELEYDVVLAPGADVSAVRLRVEGLTGIGLGFDGSLLLRTEFGIVRQHKPVAYQVIDGARRAVECGYTPDSASSRTIGFVLGEHDRNQPVVIDPLLAYSTYLGGGAFDTGNSIAVDGNGNIYVAGTTWSTDFPAASPATSLAGESDAFVVCAGQRRAQVG